MTAGRVSILNYGRRTYADDTQNKDRLVQVAYGIAPSFPAPFLLFTHHLLLDQWPIDA